MHRITNAIENAINDMQYSSAIFLDIAQAFDNVWHEGLIHKLNMLPKQHVEFLTSCLKNRFYRVKKEDEYSHLK